MAFFAPQNAGFRTCSSTGVVTPEGRACGTATTGSLLARLDKWLLWPYGQSACAFPKACAIVVRDAMITVKSLIIVEVFKQEILDSQV